MAEAVTGDGGYEQFSEDATGVTRDATGRARRRMGSYSLTVLLSPHCAGSTLIVIKILDEGTIHISVHVIRKYFPRIRYGIR